MNARAAPGVMADGPPLAQAVRRLLDLRGRDGLWGAFRMTPGQSRHWVGALAALALAEASDILPPRDAARARAVARRAAARLGALMRPDGGWGYGPGAATDSDSTAAVVRLLCRLGATPPPAALDFLASHAAPGGGWHTFRPIAPGDRWAAPTVEVDCAVALALHAGGRMAQADLAALWQGRVAPLQDAQGLWRGIWWPGPGMPTMMALDLWQAAGRPAPRPRPPGQGTDVPGFDAHLLARAEALAGWPDLAARRLAGLAARGLPTRCEARLLAPARLAGQERGEASLEGRGTMTALAEVWALAAQSATGHPLPLPPPLPAPRQAPCPAASRALPALARAAGLHGAAADLAGRAAQALWSPVLGSGLPWPNPAVSSFACGWPIEFSARLAALHVPTLRFAGEAGDPSLHGPRRMRSALDGLTRAAGVLGLEAGWSRVTAALGPAIAVARRAAPDERFFLWAGLDLTAPSDGPSRAVLKAYANLATAGDDADRLALAAAMLTALDADATPGADLCAVAATLGPSARLQQIGLAAAPGGVAVAKVYWELPGHDADVIAALAAHLGVDAGPLNPVVPGLVGPVTARVQSSGVALRFDPGRGLRPEITLATEADRRARWRPAYAAARWTDWARARGFDPAGFHALHAALVAQGDAPASLHTLTTGPAGTTAAIYLRPEGWLARHATPPHPDQGDLP